MSQPEDFGAYPDAIRTHYANQGRQGQPSTRGPAPVGPQSPEAPPSLCGSSRGAKVMAGL
jgi:hypothetical protein